MKILYDHQAFSLQKYGGISRYFCELMDKFSIDGEIDFTLALRSSNNENLHVRKSLLKYCSNITDIYPKIFTLLHTHWIKYANPVMFGAINQRESLQLIKKKNYDLFHPTYYNPYFLRYLQGKSYVLTVHDMTHELFPESFSFFDKSKPWKSQLLKGAEKIIAISENTKKDIIDIYNIDSEIIHVIYHGNPLNNVKTQNTKVGGLDKRYILFVGNRTRYKNFQFFCSSFAPILKKDKELFIYCAGGGPFTLAELSLFKKIGIQSRMCYVKPDDYILKILYTNAQAFVFPSLYEGFGLPILEAFSCGCPSILSNTSSFPEIGGDAACYFDPEDRTSLIEAANKVLYDCEYRKELSRKGIEREKCFSWEKTASETKKIYLSILNNK